MSILLKIILYPANVSNAQQIARNANSIRAYHALHVWTHITYSMDSASAAIKHVGIAQDLMPPIVPHATLQVALALRLIMDHIIA